MHACMHVCMYVCIAAQCSAMQCNIMRVFDIYILQYNCIYMYVFFCIMGQETGGLLKIKCLTLKRLVYPETSKKEKQNLRWQIVAVLPHEPPKRCRKRSSHRAIVGVIPPLDTITLPPNLFISGVLSTRVATLVATPQMHGVARSGIRVKKTQSFFADQSLCRIL
jgi:hypothetical protein